MASQKLKRWINLLFLVEIQLRCQWNTRATKDGVCWCTMLNFVIYQGFMKRNLWAAHVSDLMKWAVSNFATENPRKVSTSSSSFSLSSHNICLLSDGSFRKRKMVWATFEKKVSETKHKKWILRDIVICEILCQQHCFMRWFSMFLNKYCDLIFSSNLGKRQTEYSTFVSGKLVFSVSTDNEIWGDLERSR